MAFSSARSLYPLTVRHGKRAQEVHKERERSSLSCVHGLQRVQTCLSHLPIRYVIIDFLGAQSLNPLTVRHGKHAQDVHKEREQMFPLFVRVLNHCQVDTETEHTNMPFHIS